MQKRFNFFLPKTLSRDTAYISPITLCLTQVVVQQGGNRPSVFKHAKGVHELFYFLPSCLFAEEEEEFLKHVEEWVCVAVLGIVREFFLVGFFYSLVRVCHGVYLHLHARARLQLAL